MNAPFVVAQATAQAPANPAPKVVRITKPEGNQAVVIKLDGQTKLDLTAIASESITLVRVGERLVILFDNKATVTVEPFFDSSGKPVQDITLEVGTNQLMTPEQFATLFPITDDQSILPAAGEAGAQNTGSEFGPFQIDALLGPNPLALLGPEQLPNWDINVENRFFDEDLIPFQAPGVRIGGLVEEEHLRLREAASPEQRSDGNEDADGGADGDTPADFDITTISITGNAGNGLSLQSLVIGGDPPITFSIRSAITGAEVETAGGAPITSQGDKVFFFRVDANHVIGFADENGNGVFNGAVNPGTSGLPEGPDRIVFTLEVASNGDWTFAIYDQFDHPEDGNTESVLEVNLTPVLLATDANFTQITFTGDAFAPGVIDDVPIVFKDEPLQLKVDEDDIFNHQSIGTKPNDGNVPDGSYTGNPPSNVFGPATASGELLGTVVKVGSDEHATFSFVADAATKLESLGLTSKGDTILYRVEGNAFIGYVGGNGYGNGSESLQLISQDTLIGSGERIIFKLILQPDGSFTFELHDQLDHDEPFDDLPGDLFEPGSEVPLSDQNFDLQDTIDGDVTSIDFGQLIQVTDYDGDDKSLDGALLIKIRDDVPQIICGREICLTVNEDDIKTPLSLGTSPNDGNSDGSFTGSPFDNGAGPATVFGWLGGLFGLAQPGADEPLTFSYINEHLVTAALGALDLSSKGHELSYDIQGGVLHAYVGGGGGPGYQDGYGDRLVFKLTLEDNGQFKFELFDQIDHDPPNDDDWQDGDGNGPGSDENYDLEDGLWFHDVSSIDFGAFIKATDYDGDSVILKDQLVIKIKDDVPEVICKVCLDPGASECGVNPHDLVFQLPAGSAAISISLTDIAEGADFENALGYYFADENGNPLGGALLANHAGAPGDTSATLVIDPSEIPAGAKLLGFFIIPDGNDENSGLSDGDEITFQFEGGKWVAYKGDDALDTAQGYVLFSDRRLNPGDADKEKGDQGPDSAWEDKVSGSDNDFNDVTFDVKVCTIPMVSLIVDEDDISTLGGSQPGESLGTSPNDGNADGSYTGSPDNDNAGPATVFGSLGHVVEVGADEHLTFSFRSEDHIRSVLTSYGLTSKGGTLRYDLQGNTLYGFVDSGSPDNNYSSSQDRLVFKLTLENDGDVKFELYDQLDHDKPSSGADENFDLRDGPGEITSIDFGQFIRATDYDGDSVLLDDKLVIKVRDDVPVLKDVAPHVKTVDEDDIDTPFSHGTSVDDGAAVDGSYSGDQGVENGDNPAFEEGPANVSGSLAGLAQSGADEALTFSFIGESDARDYLEDLGLRSKGALLSYDIQSNVLYGFDNDGPGLGESYDPPADRLVFKLTLNSDGSYTFELHDQMDHDAPYDDASVPVPGDTATAEQNTDLEETVQGDINVIPFGAIIKATDNDGDSVVLGTQFGIAVRDDIPSQKQGASIVRTVEEEELDGGIEDVLPDPADADAIGDLDNTTLTATGSLAGLVDVGTDEPGTWSVVPTGGLSGLPVLTSQQKPVLYATVGNKLVAYVDGNGNGTYQSANDREVFELTVNPDGTFTFELKDEIDHVPAGDNIETILALDLSRAVKFTDEDGDSLVLSGGFTINVIDDVPVAPPPPQNLIQNGNFTDLTGTTPADWGTQATGAAHWAIAASGEGDPQPGPIQWEVKEGTYLDLFSSTGRMVDMGTSPGNIQISQDIAGLPAGAYVITLEVGAPFPGTALLDVVWNGTVVGTIDTSVSSGALAQYSFIVNATGIGPDTVTFVEKGTGSAVIPDLQNEGYHGTYLANVQLHALAGVADEDGLVSPTDHSQGNNDDAPVGDAPLADDESIATGSLGIQWGADNSDTPDAGGVQDGVGGAPGLTGRSLTFTDANVQVLGVSGPLKSQGDAVSFVIDPASEGTVLRGIAAGDGRTVFELRLSDDGTGAFTFQLFDQLDHAVGADENDIALRFNYTAKDADGDAATGSFYVGVDDDVTVVKIDPACLDVTEGGQEVGKDANFVLVLDASGSINSSQLALIKANAIDLLNDLAASGGENIRVHIVSFADNSSVVGTFDIKANGEAQDDDLDPLEDQLQAAIDAVNAIQGGGSTNYEAAFAQAKEWIEGGTVAVTNAHAFDADTIGGGSSTAYVLTDANGVRIAIVSAWDPASTLDDADGSTTSGFGVNAGDELDTTVEVLRFDFGAFDDYDGAGEYARADEAAGFRGSDVSAATFTFRSFGAGSNEVLYKVHYTDNSADPAFTSFPFDGTDGTTITASPGKLIAYIEFMVPSGEGGRVDLESVVIGSRPLLDADENTVVFLSDGEPNAELESDGDVASESPAQDALDDAADEIAAIETDDAGDDQAFQIEAYGANVQNPSLTVDGTQSFDASVGGGGTDDAYVLTAGGLEVAIVSGWDSNGTTLVDTEGGVSTGWGVEGGDEDDDLDTTTERLRFDFGSFDDFDSAGEFGLQGAGTGFDGPPVTSTTFVFRNFEGGDPQTVNYTIHFVDPLANPPETGSHVFNGANSASVPLAGTGGNLGAQIAYIEFSVPSGERGQVDLQSVQLAQAPGLGILDQVDTAGDADNLADNDDLGESLAPLILSLATGGGSGGPGEVTTELMSLLGVGADDPVTFTLLSDTSGLPALTSAGVPLVYTVVDGLLTATKGPGGDTIFTLSLESDGTAKFTLVGVLDHGGEDFLDIDFDSLIRATDYDGDATSVPLCVKVENTTDPFYDPSSFLGIVEEEQLSPVTVPAGTNIGPSEGNEDFTSHDGTNTVDFDNDPATVDGDDDSVTPFDLGNTTNSTSGQLAISGGDGALVFGFDVADGTAATFVETGLQITSQGQPVHFVLDGGVLYGVANGGGDPDKIDDAADRKVFSIVLDTGTGAFTFTLLDQLDHHPVDQADHVEGIRTVDLGGIFAVDDSDSDSADKHVFDDVTVKVIDDVPGAGGVTGFAGPEMSILGGYLAFSVGADEPATALQIKVGNGDWMPVEFGVAIPLVNGQTIGSLTINPNHTWVFTGAPDVDQDISNSVVFTLKATDADGDADELSTTISLVDVDGRVIVSSDTLTVAEEGLNDDGSDTPDTNEETDASGALQFVAGSDTLTVQFADPLSQPQPGLGYDGAAIAWAYGPGPDKTVLIGSVGGVPKIQLTLGGDLSIAPTATGDVTVTATLLDETAHEFLGTSEKNAFTIAGIKVEATDVDDAPLQATVDVAVTDDVPTIVINDPDAGGDDLVAVDEGALPVNGSWAHQSGADDPAAVAISIAGGAFAAVSYGGAGYAVSVSGEPVGTLTINNDGTWSFAPVANLTQDRSFVFTLRVTDSEGDTASDGFRIDVKNVNEIPSIVASATPVTLDEDGFGNANADTVPVGVANPNETDNNESLVQTGTVTVEYGAEQPGDLFAAFSFLDTPSLDTHLQATNGTPVVFAIESGELVGRAAGVEVIRREIISAVPNGLGDVTYTYQATLSQPLEHPLNHHEDSDVLPVQFQVTDSNGDPLPVPGTFNVTIHDDVPVAEPNTRTVMEGTLQTVDIQFIVDRSGSMFPSTGSLAFDVPGYDDDRMGLARYSMQELLDSNDQIQNVQIIRFGTGADGTAWMTKAQALAYVQDDDNWTDGGSTNYDLALQQAISSFGGGPATPSDQTFVYFLSDGAPTTGGGITDNTTTPPGDGVVTIADWESHVASQGIEHVFAVGIGSGVSVANLTPVSHPNTDVAPPIGQEDNIVIVATSDVSTLLGQLQGLLGATASISGNVLLDDPSSSTGADGFGADGGRVLSITVDGVTYTYDPVGNDITASSGPQPTQDTPVLSVTTALGGELTFYFAASGPNAAGSWSYLTGTPGPESFAYTIVDGDGDEVDSSLSITVLPKPTLTVSDAADAAEGGFATFTVGLSHGLSTAPIAVTFALTAGTAVAADYSAAGLEWSLNGSDWFSTPFSFAPGDTSVQVRVPLVDDALDEATEQFTLVATAAAGTANGSDDGTANILDNDPTPSLSIDDVTVSETAGTITFTVSLSAASGQQVEVDYLVGEDTATNPEDYTGTLAGTLTFAPGTTTQTITLTIVNDTEVEEPNETFTVTLSNPVNASIADGTGIGAIDSEDVPNAIPVITLGNFNVRDQFDDGDYNDNDGNTNWSNNWTETNEGGTNPSAGDIQIVSDLSSNRLRFTDGSDSDGFDAIQRTVNLSGATNATLTFEYRRENLSSGSDEVRVLVSNNNGSSFTQVAADVIDGSADDSSYIYLSVDISAFISANTVLRFEAPDDLDSDEYVFIDNVNIAWSTGSSTAGHTVTFTEDGGAVSISPHAIITDADDTTLTGATITLTDPQAGDTLAIGSLAGLGITAVVGANLITLSGTASLANYQAAIQAVTFDNSSEPPNTTARHVTVTVTDGTDTSAAATTTINVVAVNDPPIAENDSVITNVNDPSGTEAFSIPLKALLFNDNDAEGDTLVVTGVSESEGSFTATLDTPNGEVDITDGSGGGTFTYTLGTSPAGGTDTATVQINRSQDGDLTLDGTVNAEILLGRNGSSDVLIGNGGADVLIGGTGADDFQYNDELHGLDLILDFAVGVDDIVIDISGFGGGFGTAGSDLSGGANAALYAEGSDRTAAGSGVRFFYDNDAGDNTLWFDQTAGAGQSWVALAKLENGVDISGADIHLIT